MCAVAARRMLLRMLMQPKHIAIDVRVDGDEISGQAGDGTGQPTPFLGWLGLLAALDRLLTDGTRRD
jgi:hypothetical protein